MSQNWMRFAGINGALAVGLGAFGAHGLKSRLSEYSLEVFQSGNQYHQLYSVVILALIFLGPKVLGQDRLPIILRLFTAGTCIFSGSLYILSIGGIRWMGAITPIGGVCFILGWLFSRILRSTVLGCTALGIIGCSMLEQPEGPLAPPFSGMDRFYKKPGDNRDQPKSMLDLTRNGRLIVVFMHGECPLSLGALTRAKQIADAAPKNDIRVIGVIAQSIEEYAAWAPYTFPAAPVIADPDRKIIQNYGITKSPSFQVIGRKGSLLEKVEGWTLETDAQLQKALGFSLPAPNIPRGEGRNLTQ